MTKRSLIIIIAVVTLLPACKKDFLSPKQVDLVYNEVYWSSQNDAEKAVLGIYSLYRALMVNGQMYNRGDATTGLFNTGWNGGSDGNFYLPGNFSDPNSTQRSWGSIESYADWQEFYKVIAHANLVIAHIKTMPDNLFTAGKKGSLLGEAYFLRALTYYNIACIWGNAPLIDEAIESSVQVINADNTLVNRARSSDIEIMDSVISDAQKAIGMLNYGDPASPDWGIRANKGSALALTGYAEVWMAFLKKRNGQSNNADIANAVKVLEDVVTNGRYSLAGYPNESAVKDMYNGQSSESVFELNISSSQGESYRVDNGGVEFLTCEVAPLDSDVTQNRASDINFVPYSNKQYIYPEYPADARANLFFAAWDSPYNEPFSDVSAVATDRSKVTWMTKFASFTVDQSRQPNEYDAYFAEANIPVFRFTGVELLLAEAYVDNNEPGKALGIVNQIRSRAGLTAYSGADLLSEVLQEETSELIGEGQLYFAYVRNDYFPVPSVMTPDRYSQQGYYWPVSSNILTSNKLVKQTSYWKGKTNW